MAAPITRQLGEFIASLDFPALPEAAVGVAKSGFTDCVGTLVAGAREDVTRAVERVLLADGAKGRSSLYFGGGRAPAPAAAFVNGTAAHALDYDDVALKGSHPSAVLVPAILAEAQETGASGQAMLAAYVAGYETWSALVYRDSGNYQRKGWHPTGVLGAIAAAAACANLRGLDARGAIHALGIAASSACGVMANLGFTAKPTHPGRAASAGILAARFAAEGVEAAPDALEHPQGFLQAISPEGKVDLDSPLALPPAQWSIVSEGLSFKQYPVCYRAHRAIDALIDLAAATPVRPEDVGEIRVSFSKTHGIILKNHRPRTAIDAKFSIEFCLACALLAGRVGLRELTDPFVQRAEVQKLIERVDIDINPVEMAGTSGYSEFDQVRVRLSNGTTLASREVRHARGDTQAPLTRDHMWAKFEDCIAWSDLPIDAARLFDSLQNLERCAQAGQLFEPSVRRAAKSR
jgi:2-methylcitrate dehydratase PrpD